MFAVNPAGSWSLRNKVQASRRLVRVVLADDVVEADGETTCPSHRFAPPDQDMTIAAVLG